LLRAARRAKPSLSEKDFYRALDVFYAQHHRYPDAREMRLVPDLPGVSLPVVVEVGKVKEIVYDPPAGSRKKPFVYRHKMPRTRLVSDASGKTLCFTGSTYLDTRDGWLKK